MQEQQASVLKRYLAGEHAVVWAELEMGVDRFGETVSGDDIQAVVRETMRRVRQNLEQLVTRLSELGYDFTKYTDGSPLDWPSETPLKPPSTDIEEIIGEIEAVTGPLPLSLRLFWEVVGGVDLVGYSPTSVWPEGGDPIQVMGAEAFLQEVSDLEEEFEALSDQNAEEQVWVSLGADALHKANVSGGSYCIIFPLTRSVDFTLEGFPTATSFIDYLRLALHWGGFPGFASYPNDSTPPEILALRRDLLPL
jgi:hypothetical protein